MFLEATRAFEGEQLVRVVHDGRDLRAAADDTLVLHERVDIAIRHARDALDIEPMERLSDGWPLRLDDAPADRCLVNALAQMLELVVEGRRAVLRPRPLHRRTPPATARLQP